MTVSQFDLCRSKAQPLLYRLYGAVDAWAAVEIALLLPVSLRSCFVSREARSGRMLARRECFAAPLINAAKRVGLTSCSRHILWLHCLWLGDCY